MHNSSPLSLKHEYDLYVEREIEFYKNSVPRNVLLAIGDEAVAAIADAPQFELQELVLCEEVDRIIRKRLRIPTYQTWRRRRLKMVERYRSADHWGLPADDPIVREIAPVETPRHVLVAGAPESDALYLAANGCDVTAVEFEEEAAERVMKDAGAAGLTSRVRACVGELGDWSPDVPLNAVVCTPSAFAGLSAEQRAQVIELLKGATMDGGMHLIRTLIAGQTALTVAELERQYRGWVVSIDRRDERGATFVARKQVA